MIIAVGMAGLSAIVSLPLLANKPAYLREPVISSFLPFNRNISTTKTLISVSFESTSSPASFHLSAVASSTTPSLTSSHRAPLHPQTVNLANLSNSPFTIPVFTMKLLTLLVIGLLQAIQVLGDCGNVLWSKTTGPM